nr:PTS sugar transporter subunit IIA [uncultured Olsenella sp.]
MLENWLNKDCISLNVDAQDYRQAIQIGGDLLVANGKAEKTFVTAMIDAVADLGPYMVVAPGIAIPHARPESGAKAVGLSLVTLNSPVNFGNLENDPVWLVACLCALDSESHIELLQRFANLLADDEAVKKIKNASDAEKVIELISRY